MAIRDAAREAWVDARSGREDEARAVLAAVLEPFDVGVLDTVDVQVTDAWALFVFHDAEDDVHLAVRLRPDADGGEVHVVEDRDGWTMTGGPVTSLAHLHEVLPEPEVPEPEPEEPAGPPQWTQGVTYRIGDRVTFEGAVWECVLGDGAGNNSWRPGDYGWKQVTS